jgi:D-alanine-D-alanine ligase
MKQKTIGVLCGGLSAEREISLSSGEAVHKALRRRGYKVSKFLVDRNIDQVLRTTQVDVVFNALHGQYGEDGCIQGMLEILGVPYTGSGVLASALAMNKIKAKELFRLHNLPTPPYYTISRENLLRLDEIHDSFGFPVIAKPAAQGSSVGVSVAANLDDLRKACERASERGDLVLVERRISGREVHVGILNDRALGAIEIISHNEVFDFEAKYVAGRAHYHLPPRLSPERTRGVLTQALRAHRALGCTGATRVDMIVSDLGNEYILEVNTLPGLTPRSLLPKLARHAGLSFEDLIEEVLLGATLNSHASPLPPPHPERNQVPRDLGSLAAVGE